MRKLFLRSDAEGWTGPCILIYCSTRGRSTTEKDVMLEDVNARWNSFDQIGYFLVSDERKEERQFLKEIRQEVRSIFVYIYLKNPLTNMPLLYALSVRNALFVSTRFRNGLVTSHTLSSTEIQEIPIEWKATFRVVSSRDLWWLAYSIIFKDHLTMSWYVSRSVYSWKITKSTILSPSSLYEKGEIIDKNHQRRLLRIESSR